MKEYIKPEVEVIEFVTENVSAEAGGSIISGNVDAPSWGN